MAEYIEREALMAQLEGRRSFLFKENGDYDHYSNGFDEAVDRVENAPAADVVEVVRCKDCKYYYRYSGIADHRVCGIFNEYESDGYPTDPNDFCSYGERRADNEV